MLIDGNMNCMEIEKSNFDNKKKRDITTIATTNYKLRDKVKVN